jgi:hypothetical protein
MLLKVISEAMKLVMTFDLKSLQMSSLCTMKVLEALFSENVCGPCKLLI